MSSVLVAWWLLALALAGCGRVEVDCKKGTVSVIGGIDDSLSSLTRDGALMLSQCPKETRP